MEENYLIKSLTEDEQLIHVGKFHWMYTVHAVFQAIFGLAFAIAIIAFTLSFDPIIFGKIPDNWPLFDQIRALHPGVKIISFMVFILGILRFAQMMIAKVTTEIGISDIRLIYKRGLVARDVIEINTDRIEGVDIAQGILGRIFGYGQLIVRGMGIGAVALPQIEQPIRFKKAIEKARKICKEKGNARPV